MWPGVSMRRGSMPELDAIIPAAGFSRRMGTNKLLLPLGGKTLLEVFLDAFPYHLFRSVFLIYADDQVAGCAGSYPLHLVRNSHPERGQSYSVRLGLELSRAQDGFLFAVADQPCLRPASIERMVALFSRDKSRIVRPEVAGKPRNPVIFPASLGPQLLALEGDEGGRQVIRAHPHLLCSLEFSDSAEFVDIDTPERYQQLLAEWPRL
ncbi:hypothetical protein DP3064 [Desulfotalea psychrophila LSv54]|uniref:MobA-like NTP transferase domain-containing protein n=2 Tax=Desulfotalea psychrophila TaxID=84980 RepID=Q6AIN7_DESPS|nr:hypothetical protein DP3064 [Desulfotalea psychrophila LSv54]